MRSALLTFFALFLFCTTTLAQNSFLLVGDWKGENVSSHSQQGGFSKGDNCLFFIKEERQGVFYGQRIWHTDTGRNARKFSGIIDRRNQSIRLTEGDDGFFFGNIVSANEIELFYLGTKENPGAEHYLLHRAE